MRLAGRRILITGAASGIGAATAAVFAAEGAALALLDRDADALAPAGRRLGAYFRSIDVSDEGEVEAAVSQAAERLGGLDGVVNSAGLSARRRTEETELDLWRRIIDVNLTGTFLVCRAAIWHLRKVQGSTIVNLSSASGLVPSALAGAAYAASKGGVEIFTKVLSRELAPHIRANTVCPGFVETPMTRELAPDRDAAFEASIQAAFPLGRTAHPDEIARAILFLTCADSSYVTGISMAVDGGRTAH